MNAEEYAQHIENQRLLSPYSSLSMMIEGSLHRKRPNDGPDVLQETLVSGLTGLSTFVPSSDESPPDSLNKWLAGIAKTEILQAFRRGRTKEGESTTNLSAVTGDGKDGKKATRDFSSSEHDPLEIMVNAQLGKEITSAILDLPGDERAAFNLRRIGGLTAKEASEVLGVSVTTVDKRLSRATQKLQVQLAPWRTEAKNVAARVDASQREVAKPIKATSEKSSGRPLHVVPIRAAAVATAA